MMMVSFAQIVMMLMLGGVLPSDLEPLPVGELLHGLPAECELLGVQDVRGAYDTLLGEIDELRAQPWVLASREIVDLMTEVHSAMTSAPTDATAMLGFDPFRQLTSISLCGRLVTNAAGSPRPSLLVVTRGDFDVSVASTLARLMGFSAATLSNGVSIYGEHEEGVLFGLISPAPGLLLFGTEDLLLDRSAGVMPAGWESAPPDSLVGRMASLAAGGPRTAGGIQPSAGTRILLSGEAPVTLGQLLAGLNRALMLSDGGESYTEIVATNPEAYRDHELILGGLGAYTSASPHAMRAIAQITLGLFSADDPEIGEPFRLILRHRDAVLTYLEDHGLFSEPEVAVTGDPSRLTTTLTIGNATGMEAVGIMMGLGMFAFFGAGSAAAYHDDYPAFPEPVYEERAIEPPAQTIEAPATAPY